MNMQKYIRTFEGTDIENAGTQMPNQNINNLQNYNTSKVTGSNTNINDQNFYNQNLKPLQESNKPFLGIDEVYNNNQTPPMKDVHVGEENANAFKRVGDLDKSPSKVDQTPVRTKYHDGDVQRMNEVIHETTVKQFVPTSNILPPVHAATNLQQHSQSFTNASSKIEEVFNQVREKTNEILQDPNFNHEKFGVPIQKAGETYQKVAQKVVHVIHSGVDKLDEKLVSLESKLNDPQEMEKHKQRSLKVEDTINTTLNKAQEVITKVQNIADQLGNKAREHGLSPTQLKEEAKVQLNDIAQIGMQGGGIKGIVRSLTKNLESKSDDNTSVDSLPTNSKVIPVKVETTIDTKVIETNNPPIQRGDIV